MRHLSAITLLLLLAACDRPELLPLRSGDTILAFGDSLTQGAGVPTARSYPSVLQQLSEYPVVNAGVSGEISSRGLARLPAVLDEVRPSIMVLLHGGNDILRNMSESLTRQNLFAMVELAQGHGVQVVLIGVPQKRLFSDSAALYVDLAAQYDLPFDEDVVADLIRTPSRKSDAVHLNAQGYRELAEAVDKLLRSAGAL